MKQLAPSFLSPSVVSLCLCGLLAGPLAAQRYDSAALVPDKSKQQQEAPAGAGPRRDLQAAALPSSSGRYGLDAAAAQRGRYQAAAAPSRGGRYEPDDAASAGGGRFDAADLGGQADAGGARPRPLAPDQLRRPEPAALALRVHDQGRVHAKLDLGEGRFFAILIASTDDRMAQLPGLPMLLASKLVVASALADRGVAFDLGAPQLQHDVFLQGIALLPQGVLSSPVQVVRGSRIPASR